MDTHKIIQLTELLLQLYVRDILDFVSSLKEPRQMNHSHHKPIAFIPKNILLMDCIVQLFFHNMKIKKSSIMFQTQLNYD